MKEKENLEKKVMGGKLEECEFAIKNGYMGSEYRCGLIHMNLCLEPEKYMGCIHYKQYLKDKKK